MTSSKEAIASPSSAQSSIPTISVVMPVYNGAAFLREAVDSILAQTLEDFEFLILDDCSTDETPDILAEYAARDPRVQVFRNPRNLGIAKTLNHGLEAAQGAYIARIDADDIALPHRFAAQVGYLSAHPECALCGAQVEWFYATGGVKRMRYWALEPASMEFLAVLRPPVVHPVAMFPRWVVDRGLRYDEALETAQDYEFWGRLLEAGRGGFVNDVLLRYRLHDKTVSSTKRARQQATHRATGRAIVARRYPALAKDWASIKPIYDLVLEDGSVDRPASARALRRVLGAYLAAGDFTSAEVAQIRMRAAIVAYNGFSRLDGRLRGALTFLRAMPDFVFELARAIAAPRKTLS